MIPLIAASYSSPAGMMSVSPPRAPTFSQAHTMAPVPRGISDLSSTLKCFAITRLGDAVFLISMGCGFLSASCCLLRRMISNILRLITLDVINVTRYHSNMIVSFKDKVTERLASGVRVKAFASFERVALRKIRQLQIATCLDDLRIPPGNRLEALKGDRAGQYSIRINEQYRICFRWTESGAAEVEIIDYH